MSTYPASRAIANLECLAIHLLCAGVSSDKSIRFSILKTFVSGVQTKYIMPVQRKNDQNKHLLIVARNHDIGVLSHPFTHCRCDL